MKNTINYYYNLNPNNIRKQDNSYFFVIDQEKYYFIIYNRPFDESKDIYELNQILINNNCLISRIILNKDRQLVTLVNDIPYILINVYINENTLANLADINYMTNFQLSNHSFRTLERSDWSKLWSDKIDYFEYQMAERGHKYPLIAASISYYIGLAENAIIYVKNTTLESMPTILDKNVLSHRRISKSSTLFEIYNPLNMVIDHKVRDISEYIKMAVINGKDIWPEIHDYFNHNTLSLYGYRLLFGRLMYPTYYFDLYESIIDGHNDEKDIVNIIDTSSDYEEFLCDFYFYLKKNINLPEIEWITKKRSH